MLKKSYALCPSVHRKLEIFARAVAALLLLLTLTERAPRSTAGWRPAAEVAKFTDRLPATIASCRCARLFTSACERSVRDVRAGCVSCSWCCILRKIGQFSSWFIRDKKTASGFSRPGVCTSLPLDKTIRPSFACVSIR